MTSQITSHGIANTNLKYFIAYFTLKFGENVASLTLRKRFSDKSLSGLLLLGHPADR